MLRVVVLVSGGGTNLQAIMDALDNGTITNTEIVGVISNNKNAYAFLLLLITPTISVFVIVPLSTASIIACRFVPPPETNTTTLSIK